MRCLPAGSVLVALCLGVVGCGGGTGTHQGFDTSSSGPPPATAHPRATSRAGEPASGDEQPRVVGVVARHLAVPWGVAFLPDRSALVTERDTGRVLHLADGAVSEVGHLALDGDTAEGGLLGIAVSPTFSRDHRVFLYETTARDNRVLRATYAGGRLSSPMPILTGIPRGLIHDGGRLAFGPDRMLYVSTGETGDGELAQDPSSLGGKILRVTQDGRPAPGNPRAGSPVFTIGHRNVQGLAFDPHGRLWASEFGDSTWDELNLVRRGTNYGWPAVEGRGHDPAYRNPVLVWRTSEASPSGLAFDAGHLWMGSLRGERLWRITVHGTEVSDPEDFFVGRFGRMRTVVTAPDGNLWVTTSNRDGRGTPAPADDRILEIRP
jgi:glucose/arabinose dehydrogenase